jgi:hypothetical protein
MDGMTDSDDEVYSESDNDVFLSDGEPCGGTAAPPVCRFTIIDATALGKEQVCLRTVYNSSLPYALPPDCLQQQCP